MIARSSTLSLEPAGSNSPAIARTARAPVSEENFSSGIPVRSPAIRTPA
jgi:hypothetical protein